MNGKGHGYGHEGFDGYIRYEVKSESIVMGFEMKLMENVIGEVGQWVLKKW